MGMHDIQFLLLPWLGVERDTPRDLRSHGRLRDRTRRLARLVVGPREER
jgi:hypothetical protein